MKANFVWPDCELFLNYSSTSVGWKPFFCALRDISGTKCDFSVQVQLRFCLSETSCPQEDHFPPSLCVKVNGKPCNLPVRNTDIHTQYPSFQILCFSLYFKAVLVISPCFCHPISQGYLPPTKNGVEPKRPSRPINITSLVRLSTTVPNTIVGSWTAEIGRVRGKGPDLLRSQRVGMKMHPASNRLVCAVGGQDCDLYKRGVETETLKKRGLSFR